MALDLQSIGKTIGPLTRAYTWKDVVLYALGVGAGFDELEYCYEKQLKVIPSFSIAAAFEFLTHAGIASNVNPAGILHGEQELIFHHPIPPEGTLITQGCITHCYDKGKDRGALVVIESETVSGDGIRLFTSIATIFSRLDGGFGGENAPKIVMNHPDRAPDFVVPATPGPQQPLIYRLSGDTFQLHVDPEFARLSGFDKPIMHGLCTHGYACRALMAKFTPMAPERVRRLSCRFSRPLYPGKTVETRIWKTAEGSAVFETVDVQSGKAVISNGVFEYGEVPKDEIRFDNQVAIITGAGAGLGRVYAIELAKRGARVVVNDLGGARDGSGHGSRSPADLVVKEIQDLGAAAVASYDNVATPEGGDSIVKTALEHFGTVDILVNNAGILNDKSFLKMEPENWHAVVDVHLNGAFHVSRPAFAVMKQKGYGRIIMTTSAAGLYGNFGQANYAAAKMGLVGLMNTLNIEGEKYNIKVNTIAPIAASRLTADILPPDLLQRSKPEFVAPMVLYLCSQRCPVSGHIYNAGMGFFNRAAVVSGLGAVLGDTGHVPTTEDLKNQWDQIFSLKDGKTYGRLNDLVGDILEAFSKPDEKNKTAKAPKSVAEVFSAMETAFVPEAASGLDVVFQYDISGSGGGNWACEIKDGRCTIAAGTHERPTCTLKMQDTDFLAMMTGQLPSIQAFTSGKLKITGDVMKSQLIERLFKRRQP